MWGGIKRPERLDTLRQSETVAEARCYYSVRKSGKTGRNAMKRSEQR